MLICLQIRTYRSSFHTGSTVLSSFHCLLQKTNICFLKHRATQSPGSYWLCINPSTAKKLFFRLVHIIELSFFFFLSSFSAPARNIVGVGRRRRKRARGESGIVITITTTTGGLAPTRTPEEDGEANPGGKPANQADSTAKKLSSYTRNNEREREKPTEKKSRKNRHHP